MCVCVCDIYVYIWIYIYGYIYRQELRDFINKLLNDAIKCRITENDDDFKEKYFPKLILDGGTET